MDSILKHYGIINGRFIGSPIITANLLHRQQMLLYQFIQINQIRIPEPLDIFCAPKIPTSSTRFRHQPFSRSCCPKHPANMFSCFFVSVLILDSFWWFVNDFHPSRIIFSVFHVFIYFFCLYSQQYVMLVSKKIFSKQLRYTAPCFIISSM